MYRKWDEHTPIVRSMQIIQMPTRSSPHRPSTDCSGRFHSSMVAAHVNSTKSNAFAEGKPNLRQNREHGGPSVNIIWKEGRVQGVPTWRWRTNMGHDARTKPRVKFTAVDSSDLLLGKVDQDFGKDDDEIVGHAW